MGIAVFIASVISHEVDNDEHLIVFFDAVQAINDFFVIKIGFCCFSYILVKPFLLLCLRCNDSNWSVPGTVLNLVRNPDCMVTGSFGNFQNRNCIF